jgi:hypothetical protein
MANWDLRHLASHVPRAAGIQATMVRQAASTVVAPILSEPLDMA